MRIHTHDGYDDYKSAQIEKNIRKFDTVWAKKVEIKACCDYMISTGQVPKNGLCHGVRNGWEMTEFTKFIPECVVIGTDISPTIKTVPNGIEHDFHEPYKDWDKKMDFVYSNSLDHSYDPKKAISIWSDQLVCGGFLFIGWFEKNGCDKADCFLASNEEVEGMIESIIGVPRIVCDARKGYVVFGARK